MQVLPHLLEALKLADEDIRLHALKAITQLALTSHGHVAFVLRQVGEVLKDRYENVRRLAVDALVGFAVAFPNMAA